MPHSMVINGDEENENYYMSFDNPLRYGLQNKRTSFLHKIAIMMDKDNVVRITPQIRDNIVDDIGCKSNNKSGSSSAYISNLIRLDLMVRIERSVFMINPLVFGRNKSKAVIKSKHNKYLEYKRRDEVREHLKYPFTAS
jgi:hypothetical protein